MKLLVRIIERIEIFYIIIVFVSVLVSFVIAALSWLTLPGYFPFELLKQALTQEWALAQDTMVVDHTWRCGLSSSVHNRMKCRVYRSWSCLLQVEVCFMIESFPTKVLCANLHHKHWRNAVGAL